MAPQRRSETKEAQIGIRFLRAEFPAAIWPRTHRGESTMANRTHRAALVLASALLTCGVAAQEDPDWDFDFDFDEVDESLPDGFELMERHAEAIGGVEGYKALRSIRLTGLFDIPSAGITGADVVISSRAPDARHTSIEIEGFGTFVTATDGKLAWSLQPGMAEPSLFEEEAAASVISQADLMLEVEPRRKYKLAETLMTVEHDGKQCYHVKIITQAGDTHGFALFEVESGLKVKEGYKASPDHLVHHSVTTYSDYRKEGELMHAWKLDILEGSEEQTLTLTKVEHDVELDDELFEPPATE